MKRKRLLLFAGLGVLLLCACGSLLLFFMPNREETTTTERTGEVAEVVEETATPEAAAEATAETETVAEPTSEPTAEPTATAEPTSTPLPPPEGTSRGNPYPMDALVEAPNWDIQVLEVVRGEEAWAAIQAANQFNEPPPDGMQYVLVRLKAVSTHADAESHLISGSDFHLTGDRFQRYRNASVVAPEPELSGELFTGGETEGWIAFAVGQDEGQLMLVVDELANFDDDRFRYIALDEGASVTVDPALFDIEPTDVGLTRLEPAPLGETAITEDWEITVTEVMRGDDAWAAVQAINQFNEPPAEGMEYVAAKLLVRYIGTADQFTNIDGSHFNLTGEANILYNWPSVVDPDPALDVYLYPGGQYEGWTVMEARAGEGHLMLRYEPFFELSEANIRYLALVEGASVAVPAELADIEPNDLGRSRENPAPLGETVVTDDWEFTVLEVVRGNNALTMAQEANQFNDPPEPGTEYVAVKVRVRNISLEDQPVDVSGGFFSLVDDSNVEYEPPSVVDPEPALDIALYPGGEYEGWVILQAGEGNAGLVAVVSPLFSFEEYYLSLEP